MRKNDALLSHIDWPLFIAFISLLIFGMATVYSVAFNEEHPNIFAFSEKYGKQMLWLGVSLFLGLLIFLIDVDNHVQNYAINPVKLQAILIQNYHNFDKPFFHIDHFLAYISSYWFP